MQLWILCAALAPLFWSFSNFIDQFMARDTFKDSVLSYFLFISITKLPALLLIFLAAHDYMALDGASFLGCFIPAVLYLAGVCPYIYALKRSDAAMAIPIFQTMPFFVYLLGWALLGELISLENTLYGLLIVLASIGIVWEFHTRRFNWGTLALMLASSVLLSFYFIALRYFADGIHFAQITFSMYAWYFLLALAVLLALPARRREIVRIARLNKGRAVWISLLEDVFDVGGTMFIAAAMALAPAAVMVSLLLGLQPFYVLIIGALLGLFLPGHFERAGLDRILTVRIACILLMFAGLAGLLL